MVKGNLRLNFLFTLVILVFFGILITTPVDSQFSGFTITPPNSAIGYGGLFNPYVFWPGIGLNSAASTSSLIPFLPFGFTNFGLTNPLLSIVQPDFSQFNLGGFGFGAPIPVALII